MGRIIEAKAVISGEDRLSPVIDRLDKRLKGFGKGMKLGAEVDRLAKGLAQAETQLRAIDKFRGAQAPFAAARTQFRAAHREVERVARELDGARRALAGLQAQAAPKNSPVAREAAEAKKRVGELERQLTSAQRTVKAASATYERHAETLKESKRAAESAGVAVNRLGAEHARVKRHIVTTGEAIDRQARAQEVAEKRTIVRQERMARRREALGTIGAGAAVVAAHKGKAIGIDAINSAAEFDIAVRKQRVFTDISRTAQAGLLGQAKRIGQETQFSNIDVVKAQTASMQGLPASFAPDLKAAVAEGIVENVRNYATLMETDLKEGAETIRGYLQQTGKDISTKEKALKEANLATNQLVKMAKLGGMNGDDVAGFMKFAASSGTSAGISSETLMSLAALARRGGLRGDEAGTFIRAASAKLVSPTNPGLAALNAAGIKYSDYVTMPEKLSTSALEGQFQLKIGKSFTPAMRKKLDAINGDASLIGDRGKYTEAVVKAVGDILGKSKKGTVKAQDAAKAAKAVNEFHKVSARSVDTERLLDDAMSKGMTLPQLNAWLTDKHGGKGAITQRAWDEFKAARGEIKKAGDNPNYAGDRAKEVMAGLGGSVENLKGSFENFILQLGTANEALIKFSADGLGNAVDSFSKLDQSTQQILTLLGGGAAASGGAYGAYKLASNLLGGGGSAALDGSAAKLTGAAAALEAAAARLGGGAAVGAAASGSGAAAAAGGGAAVAGAAARTTVMGGLRAAGIAGILGYAGWKGLEALDAWMPTARPGARFSPLGNAIPGKGGEEYGPPMPPTRARSLYEIRNGLPAGGVKAPASTPVPVEVKALPQAQAAPPALTGGSPLLGNTLEKAMAAIEARTGKPSDKPVEAAVKPDQIQANVKPDQVTAKLEGKAEVSVTVKVDGPGTVTAISSSSSGNVQANGGMRGRSMPQAAGNPGGA